MKGQGEKHAKTNCTFSRSKCQWENKTAMKDLKAEFGKLGYENAATLLNSGNIVFESAESLFIFFICNKLLYAQKLFF